MAISRRTYKGAAVANALSGSPLLAGATSINLANAMSGWSTSSEPFFVVIDPGTSKEEKVCVKYNTSTSLTVVDPAVTSGWTASANGRGVDDTTDRQHDAGATIYPVFTATEADEANELISKYTTNGDIVVHGASGFKTVSTGGSGNNNKVLIADSTVTDGGVKWGQVATTGIADLAVTEDKLANNAVTSGKIANGTIVNDDIKSDAAIAYSKLALSNSIVAGDITSNAVTTAKILDANVTNAKLDYSTVPQMTVSTSDPSGGKNGDIWVKVV